MVKTAVLQEGNSSHNPNWQSLEIVQSVLNDIGIKN